MQECYHQVLGTLARLQVNKLQTCLLGLLKSLCNILYIESNVVDTASASVLLNELGYCRLRASRLQKFNLCLANLEESGLNLLVCNFLNAVALATGQ